MAMVLGQEPLTPIDGTGGISAASGRSLLKAERLSPAYPWCSLLVVRHARIAWQARGV